MIGTAGVWALALGMSAFALTMMLALIVYSAFARRLAGLRAHERRRSIEMLKARTEPAGETVAGDVLTDLSVQILELVRGDEKADFAERMARSGVVARLHRRLRRGRARKRILAAAALVNFHDETSRAALTAALDDRNAEVRLTAALSLGANGLAPPPAELIRRLDIGRSQASLRTIMLLTELAETDVAGVRALLGDPAIAPAVKAGAARALALNGDYASIAAVAALAAAAEPASPELPRLLNALARFEHPAGSDAVLGALASPSPLARAAAARAAGRIGIEAAIPRLARLLGDPDWWVRLRASRALLRFGEPGLAVLRRVAEGGIEPARKTAELMLAEAARAA